VSEPQPSVAGSKSDVAWHAVEQPELLRKLGTTTAGLSEEEAAQRLAACGPNRLPRRRRAGPLQLFLRQFRSPLFALLLAAALVSAGIGDLTDAGFIMAVLLLNAAIGAAQKAVPLPLPSSFSNSSARLRGFAVTTLSGKWTGTP